MKLILLLSLSEWNSVYPVNVHQNMALIVCSALQILREQGHEEVSQTYDQGTFQGKPSPPHSPLSNHHQTHGRNHQQIYEVKAPPPLRSPFLPLPLASGYCSDF